MTRDCRVELIRSVSYPLEHFICPRCSLLTSTSGVDRAAVCDHCGHVFRPDYDMTEEEAFMQIPWDDVQCTIKLERDIVSDTARVVVNATIALASEDSARVRAILTDALSGVLGGGWEFASIERAEDSSGMEQVVAVASTRVKEHLTGGLVDRLAKASRPGMKLSLAGIITSPPKAEILKASLELRKAVYEAAQKEADTLNELYKSTGTDQAWRVGGIVIEEQLIAPKRPSRTGETHLPYITRHRSVAVSMPDDDDMDPPSPDVQVSTRLLFTAKVRLKRLSVPVPAGGLFGLK